MKQGPTLKKTALREWFLLQKSTGSPAKKTARSQCFAPFWFSVILFPARLPLFCFSISAFQLSSFQLSLRV
jgi:hypothetical protein